jgi:hypothetical protein
VEGSDKLLRMMLGASGFQPPTSWSRTRFQRTLKSIEIWRFQAFFVEGVARSKWKLVGTCWSRGPGQLQYRLRWNRSIGIWRNSTAHRTRSHSGRAHLSGSDRSDPRGVTDAARLTEPFALSTGPRGSAFAPRRISNSYPPGRLRQSTCRCNPRGLSRSCRCPTT